MYLKDKSPGYTLGQTTKYFQWSALLEGTTLVLLVLVAVPTKYLLGEPALVRAMGPIHGIAFLAYSWSLMQLQGAAAWPLKRSVMMFCAALIPFGSYVALSRLGRHHAGVRHADQRRP